MTGQAVGKRPARAVPAIGQAAVRAPRDVPREIPEATAVRLATYLRVLAARPPARDDVVSSAELARSSGVNPAGLRKDLSFLGSYGTRGVGYHVGTLTDQIRFALGAHQAYRVALVGVGNLGSALVGYRGFAARGFEIAAVFDVDAGKIGTVVHGHQVHPVDRLGEVCCAEAVSVAVMAVPEVAAQSVLDELVQAGIRSILDFAPGMRHVPPGVEIRHVDLALELQILGFLQSRHRREAL